MDRRALNTLSFEELLELMRPTLIYHSRQYKIPGYDSEDIFQELSFKLWRDLGRIPADMRYYDWRFIRYWNKGFHRLILDLYKKRISRYTHKPFDELDRATSLEGMFDHPTDVF